MSSEKAFENQPIIDVIIRSLDKLPGYDKTPGDEAICHFVESPHKEKFARSLFLHHVIARSLFLHHVIARSLDKLLGYDKTPGDEANCQF